MIIRVVAILFLLIFASFEAKKFISKSKNDLSVENIKKEINLESGDIILKREDNELSNYLATFDSSGYSHIGLIIDTKYGLKVVHIDIDEKNDELQISDLNDFVNFSTKIAVYRHKEKIDIKKLSDIINDLEKRAIKFDYDFYLDNDKLYSTELINYIFFKLFDENLYLYLLDFYEKDEISINSIIKNPKLEKKFEIDFKF
ncbi:YiiX/YebB-like N1pC/P60 family cysteine hydrolase [Aliarcobacter cryaerophilus]|uniref:YiiX/YebB-like N1pC/P60 family cysteine hydrolase n=1 Tax=Aliarcobacter cryaerophilus TaxID=28198 RepID=UPI0021B4CB7F|nr:YiiX/YebB-like N1pC/P60 family cysteine hydrolase [Aliarcobacter cryaerophilus]MCT7498630.1 YiiX/YebB-like N1pC/P60 family cysteine hydrolase [Aliarcobacter cryaerophilus]MCT7543250.1 YiiX/YebB-like N1pC/P60 family cysteine hydrolase [Aliarcobacter cryaerophilus]